jgi:3-deoxy-manno-octulosonate cytidylyltransferase (CMP-KDO synthetase)
MITAGHLERLLRPFDEAPATQVSTLKVGIGADTALDRNVVKVVTDLAGRALYFSRARIPFDRDGSGQAQYFKHQGFYAFSAAALEKFHHLPPSPLEKLEKLEQLRFLENGIGIAVVETSYDTIGVDSEEDLRRVEEYFHRLHSHSER